MARQESALAMRQLDSSETNVSAGKTLFGICLCLAAITIAAIGIVLQRKSKLVDGAKNQSKFAVCGTVFMLLSAIPDVWAWALVPQVLVASVYTSRTVPVCLLGHFCLQEHLQRKDWFGLVISIAGSVLSVASGPRVAGTTTPETASSGSGSSGKLGIYVALGSFVLVSDGIIAGTLLRRHTGETSSWALRCSWIFLAAYVFVFEKVFNTLAGKDYDSSRGGLDQPAQYYFEVAALAVLGLLDLGAQIMALRVVPVHVFETSRTAIVQLLVLLQGGLVFEEFEGLSLGRMCLTFLGVSIALAGSFIIQQGESVTPSKKNDTAAAPHETVGKVEMADVKYSEVETDEA